MPRIIVPAVIAASLLCLSAAAQDKPAKPHNDAKDTYAVTEIEGWKVLISARYGGQEELRDRVLDEVRSQLRRITMLLRPEALAEMRKVEIWVELDYPMRCQYHPNKGWLVGNGYVAEKAKTIEIANARGFLSWQSRPVMTLLHELVHAYHDRVLGFGDERILEAYSNYRKANDGEKVVRDTGHTTRHYALTDHKEYFAEMTEAYLWVNDYYPFVFGELKEADPGVVSVMEAIWGKRR